PRVSDDGNTIYGSVIYIDNYGNVVTNIQESLFKAHSKGREFELLARNKKIREIHNKYGDIINYDLEKDLRKAPGELLALFNSSGYIEISLYKSDHKTVGGASSLLGLDYRDTILITLL